MTIKITGLLYTDFKYEHYTNQEGFNHFANAANETEINMRNYSVMLSNKTLFIYHCIYYQTNFSFNSLYKFSFATLITQ